MDENFFSGYKDFVVHTVEAPTINHEENHPQSYAAHYILTITLFESLISNWNETLRFGIDAKSCLQRVLEQFNQKQKGNYLLQLLELEKDLCYFVLAFSSKVKLDHQEADDHISRILDNTILTPLYIGESWYRLVGYKARVQRKLFSFAYKEYVGERNTGKLIPYPATHSLSSKENLAGAKP